MVLAKDRTQMQPGAVIQQLVGASQRSQWRMLGKGGDPPWRATGEARWKHESPPILLPSAAVEHLAGRTLMIQGGSAGNMIVVTYSLIVQGESQTDLQSVRNLLTILSASH